jgi:hypothetical protein
LGDSLGKAAVAAPLYISVAWTLMVSYQLFTQIAVSTVIAHLEMFWPALGVWLLSRMDMLIFIYAFAWVFLLSSVIPSIILGKERSVLVQFFVCLTLTFLAFIVQDTFTAYGGKPFEQFFSLGTLLLCNPFLAGIYLFMPYALMLVIDIRARRRNKKLEKLEETTSVYINSESEPEQAIQDEELTH